MFGALSDHHQQHRRRSFEDDVQPIPPPLQLKDIYEEDLIAYEGIDPQNPLLMAIKGQIYDDKTCILLINFLGFNLSF
ncbi:hypothetical protein Hanom_Chr10g00896681 [Helianthus anomalus]